MAGIASFVLEQSTNPGTGAFTLQGAPPDRVTFGAAFPNGSGSQVYYFADDGTQAEWGVGTLTYGSPSTLARTTMIGNTAGSSSHLNFTGSVNVYNEVPGERTPSLETDGSLLIGATRSDRVKTESTTTLSAPAVGDHSGIQTAAVSLYSKSQGAVAKNAFLVFSAIADFDPSYTPGGDSFIMQVAAGFTDAGGNPLANASDEANVQGPVITGKIVITLSTNSLTPGAGFGLYVQAQLTGVTNAAIKARLRHSNCALFQF